MEKILVPLLIFFGTGIIMVGFLVLYAAYLSPEARLTRIFCSKFDRLIKLIDQGDLETPEGQELVRQCLSALQEIRIKDPEVNRLLDVEKFMARITIFLK